LTKRKKRMIKISTAKRIGMYIRGRMPKIGFKVTLAFSIS